MLQVLQKIVDLLALDRQVLNCLSQDFSIPSQQMLNESLRKDQNGLLPFRIQTAKQQVRKVQEGPEMGHNRHGPDEHSLLCRQHLQGRQFDR